MKSKDKLKLGILSVAITFGLVIAACNKNIDATSNKSYLSATNLSPNAPPLKIVFELTDTLTGSTDLVYDSTTGIPGNPYLTAVAGIHNLQLLGDNGVKYVDGNIGLIINNHYSLFIYDSVTSSNTVNTLILQDVLNPVADTSASVRFLNFSSNTPYIYIQMDGLKDTFLLGGRSYPYVGINHTPALVTNNNIITAGTYHMVATVDNTSYYDLGFLTFAGSKIYTIYTKSPMDSTATNTVDVIQNK